jgi:putative transposase
MARQLRIEYEGAFYHITSRGNQKGHIFWDERDRHEFKKILVRTKERYGYLLHAYVLMDNHFHLLIETPLANIKQIMQNINTSYTVYVNRIHDRVGHLFQGRYKAFIVDKENYLLELGRYIHLNPVRAGIVKMPEDYRWSSYNDYILRGRGSMLVDTKNTLCSFSTRRSVAAVKYREFVNAGIREKNPLEETCGSIAGGEEFKERVLKHLKQVPDQAEIKDIRKIEPRHEIEDILRAVTRHYELKKEDLLKRTRTFGKQRGIAVFLCKTLSGKKNAEIGKVFGITLQGVTNTLRRISIIRDKDKEFADEIISIKKVFHHV